MIWACYFDLLLMALLNFYVFIHINAFVIISFNLARHLRSFVSDIQTSCHYCDVQYYLLEPVGMSVD